MLPVDPSHAHLSALVDRVLAIWPAHARYLGKSLSGRDPALLAFSDRIAGIVLRLGAAKEGGLDQLCHNYRFICEDVVLAEEIHFRRHGRYRLTSFEEALRTVYNDAPFMTRYMNGLLVTDVLWVNHCRCMQHYVERFLPGLPEGAALLEIGPGHGLLLTLALQAGRFGSLEAWDVSDASLRLSRHTLDALALPGGVTFTQRNIFEPVILSDAHANRFDGVVLSEVLEHLERPVEALEAIRHVLKPGGRVWVNVPANSPAPDHLFLVRNPDEAASVVRAAGLTVVETASFPMSGVTLERAIDQALTLSCVVVGEKSA